MIPKLFRDFHLQADFAAALMEGKRCAVAKLDGTTVYHIENGQIIATPLPEYRPYDICFDGSNTFEDELCTLPKA